MKRFRLSLVAALLVAGCQSSPRLDTYSTVEDFQGLTERSGRSVSRADLQGKVWIASCIFTHCNGPCPGVTAAMARLQKDLGPQPNLLLVSFTVDPERDTPAELKKYADSFSADPERWLFLTGDKATIYRIIQKSLLLGVGENEGTARRPGEEFIHSTLLVLVDRKGVVRGFIHTDNEQEMADVPRKVAYLLREKS